MKTVEVYQSKLNGNEFLEKQSMKVEFLSDSDPNNPLSEKTVSVFPERRYQEILGFGGSFTEASAYNYSLMSENSKKKIIDAYFGSENGLGYNFCRTTIHSSDFSLDNFTYVEENDTELKTFDIGRDRKYTIPFIKDALKCSGKNMYLYASPWSPPGWMKDTGKMIEGGRLLDEYYGTWADYFVKYFEHYKEEGIDFFGMSVQNEAKAWQTWESCLYSAEEEGIFVHNYLKPALKKAGLDHLNIMIWDHNKERVYERPRDTFNKVPGVIDDVWGIAFHWYSGDHLESLDMVHECYPDKKLILSEFCLGVEIGESITGPHSSWLGAEIYAGEIIKDFNHYMSAVVDWNMIVDENGGPFHHRSVGCKAPVVVDPKTDTVSLEPIYYAIAHFSRFVKRGAVRIGCSTLSEQVKAVAFSNPDGDIIVVVLNLMMREENLDIRFESSAANVTLPAHSLTTYVIK